MSPLWRDQLRVVLCPDRVLIVRLRRGLRPSIGDKHCISCDPVIGMPTWFAPLNALLQWVSNTKPPKANIVIVLSNHFVRYGVLPWSADIGNADEEMAFARIYFEKIFGDISKKWDIRISQPIYQAPRIASAVDQELVGGLNDIFNKTSLRLESIQPYLMTAFNACRKQMKNQQGRFLLIEPGKASFLKLVAGKCVDIKSYPLQDAIAEELAELVDREIMLDGLDEGTNIFLCNAEHGQLQITGQHASLCKAVFGTPKAGFHLHTDVQFGMALIGMT